MSGTSLACILATVFVLMSSAQAARAEDAVDVRRVLIVCGHPGDEAHHKLFAETVERLQKGLIQNLKVDPDQIVVQFGAEAMSDDPAVIANARGQATREEIADTVNAIRAESSADDSLWVIVMGHSHFDGRNAFLNLPGPDLRADEFAKLFAGMMCQEQVFFITCPVSGYFIKPLAAPFRVVMTATEADQEINETDCASALADVFSSPPHRAAFDVDEDGQLTLLDLYVVLVRRVIERYAAAMAVVTEHALLEDNGDGRGSEVQVDYLTEEQGGRWKPGSLPAKPKRDGIFTSRVPLAIQVPEQAPALPADALVPENPALESAAI